MIDNYEFEIKDDYIVRRIWTPVNGENVYKEEVVMDKATFVEAFEKWCKQRTWF